MRLPAFWRKVGFVPQMEMAECGAACLAMVLGHFGRHVPLGSLRVQCGVGRDGVTAEGLVRTAREHGLRALGVRVEQAQLRRLPCPLIVHWDFNHFIVIERFGRGGAQAVDPALGRRWLSARELDESFTGVALVFEPGPDFERRGRAPGALGPHLGALAAQRGGAAFLIGSAFMLQLLSVLAPGANQILIDHVLPPQRVSWLWTILGGLAAVGCARLLFSWLRGRSLLALYLALELGLLSRLLAKLFTLPCAFFDQRTPGDLLQRVRASSQLSQLSATLVLAALDLFMVLAVTGLMLAYDPRLGALACALSLLQIGCVFALRARTRQLASSELALRGRETSAAVDGLSIPEVARAFGLSRQLAVRHTNRVVRRVNVSRQLRLQTAAVSSSAVLLDGAARALLLYLGGLFVLEQRLSIGAFVGFLTLQSMLSAPLASLVEAASQVSYVKGLLSRMADVLDAESESSGELVPEKLRGEIDVLGVSYRYGNSGPWVCEGIDLRIPAGQTVAIVGRSGAGKSTLAKLLVGLLSPTRGQICIDGRPLGAYALDALRRRIGIVLQEPVLFDASLRDNLDLAQQGLSDEALHAALEGACVRELVSALPDGLDAQLGDCGGRVSGGQRQRLALARALAARPDILLLDEATSSLDPETEQRVQSALAARSCTRVVIAHRLRSVQQADRVLVMEGGRLVQDGSYAALSAAAGPFRSLMGELA